MTFLGLRTRMLAKGLGLSPNAIDMACVKGCRGSRWLPAISQLLDVPVATLLNTSPEDPAARKYRLPALVRAANIRMRDYRFERPVVANGHSASNPPQRVEPSKEGPLTAC